ncbi:MAG TPA: patatin-like protein [Pyrinomonadaceae bacterium]
MSQPPPPPAAEKGTRPEVQYTQEVRFAVVMYGGSSLAIYMNGVAQELLRLVRSTAPARDGERALLPTEELEGSTRVYRKLGQLLARGEEVPASAAQVGAGDDLRTRFIIDILTGTSAGGINAVYLAKALANNQPLDELKKLWVTEGDIGVLLNDAKSDEGLKLGGQKPPRSLLNSQRMYLKLLEALRGMDKARRVGDEEESPLVDELDLFVTATDMSGRLLRLRLADGVAHERRHRNVFRFRYYTRRVGGEHRNDFRPAFNPFLAFASRCTSAHQAAFEVMRLMDIEQPVRKFPPADGAREHGVASEELKEFYKEYIQSHGDAAAVVPFHQRSFSDGGVLDNSPFSFASDALPFRHTDAPVDRKLVYIEPSPEHPEFDDESAERPDFFSNALMALSTLPRYQTIVEDLMRVLERNRLIERANHIILGLEEDLKWRKRQGKYEETPDVGTLLKDDAGIREWARGKRNDLSWGGYQRLRVAEVTDDLTLLVARAAGFDEESDEFTAVRYLVRQWRDDHYADDAESAREPQVKFLLLFDLMWLVRRLKFLLTKINEISCFDRRAWQVLEAAREENEPQLWPEGGRPEATARKEMRQMLLSLKREIAEAFTDLRVARRRLWSRDQDNAFVPYVAALGIRAADLLALLEEPTDQARRDHAARLLGRTLEEALTGETRARLSEMLRGQPAEGGDARLLELLDRPGATRMDVVAALTEKVVEELGRAMRKARGKCAAALRPRKPRDAAEPAAGETVAAEGGADGRYGETFRRTLWYYYRRFSDYDQVSHPILHATEVGEELDPVEVFRISPEDATFLVNEKEQRVHKLAGTTLGHFGAFFEERFRHNDIMWGRLDAAERVIHVLLPREAQRGLREELTAEAQRAIIIEETIARHLAPTDKEELNRLVRETLAQAGGDDGAALAAALAAKLKGTGIDPSLKSFLGAFLEKVDPLDKFRRDFEVNYEAERAFTPRDSVVNAGRASRVFGRMVDGIAAERRRGGSRLILWLVRLTRWVWGLAQVAVPGSIWNLFTRHLLRVIYFFEAALIFFGLVFASKELQRFGLVGFALTAFLHVALLFVGDFILGGSSRGAKSRRRLRLILRIAVVVAVVGGLAFLLFKTNNSWLPSMLKSIIDVLEGWRKTLS